MEYEEMYFIGMNLTDDQLPHKLKENQSYLWKDKRGFMLYSKVISSSSDRYFGGSPHYDYIYYSWYPANFSLL